VHERASDLRVVAVTVNRLATTAAAAEHAIATAAQFVLDAHHELISIPAFHRG
jgi:uncharacterized protein YggE